MIMECYSKPLFDLPRKWIKCARNRNIGWNDISLAGQKDETQLKTFLEGQIVSNFWPELSVEDWRDIVSLEKTAEENTKFIDISRGTALIYDYRQDNAVTIPNDEHSSWQLYRSKLLKGGFKQDSVDEIERSTIKILKRLCIDTVKTDPIKGLVIGNVQSGKTANMAALMAMAADWGWNMFIILSGTIDNLREQTQTRLFNDLNQQGNLNWRVLEHLSKGVDIAQKAQNLHFEDSAKDRYFTVCLKNSARLRHLIQWAQADKNKQRQMKIIVIDDEADQAGINTARVDAEYEERKKINGLICSLVNGKSEGGKDIDTKYQAMNYIGYTATPYANILNEAGEDSLYPRNFISTLAVSKEYFGPQQIFGYSGDSVEFSGMDIVRTISEGDLDTLKNIHNGNLSKMPDSLIDATAWFLCGVSCMRIWGYKKPISMLIHTSQKTAHHQYIADVIEGWFTNKKDEVLEKARTVWNVEKTRFGLREFREQYPEYDRKDEEINQYPDFSEVEEQIKIILGRGVSNIKMDGVGDLSYHEGVHLCIDNCTNNGITDGMHVRLAYPEPSKMPEPAPAFIVIGGATLSRGLTIEGLISTFFLRSVGQADTLMQMGRWFGYRKEYELLPRIWMTQKTKEQFRFLAELDQELRDEILYMDVNGRSPTEYGPKVKNSPKVSFIRITANNRMQSAQETDMVYSGASNQTELFDNDEQILSANIELTDKFLKNLGAEWVPARKSDRYSRTAIWKGVSFDIVKPYLEKFKFQERLRVLNNIKPLLDWIGTETAIGKLGSWNVVVAGKETDTNGTWILPNGKVLNKVRRSKKKANNELEDKIINIGTLRDPKDLLADVDIDSIEDETVRKEICDYIRSGQSKAASAFRDKSGLKNTPQLLIYRVDKDSGANGTSRIALDAPADLLGICLYIPGERIGTSYASSVSIKMNNDLFDGGTDLEDVGED